jgi:plastocyanin
MDKKATIGIIAAISIILLGAWAYMMAQPAVDRAAEIPATNSNQTTPETSPPAEEEGAQPTSETSPVAIITYTDDGFTPSTLTVKKDSAVTVTNKSSKNVMFSSADHPTHQKQPELNMQTLKPGESGTITITKAGTWGYHDHINETMTGTITVTE